LENKKKEHNMQSQNNMNKIRQLIRISKTIGLLLFFAFMSTETKAQCSITVGSSPCVGEPVLFNCNAIGGKNFSWNFNSEGVNTSLCNPTFVFNSAGTKKIDLTLTLANGNTCNATIDIVVKPKPIINITRVVNKTQCFANNSFCFDDKSISGEVAGNICRTRVVFDDGVSYTFNGNGPRTFCHSFGNPAGGTYGMTVELEDCNGCLTKSRINEVAVVHPSMGLSFSSPRPQACDSVRLCVTNNSVVPLDSVISYVWDWGDGQTTFGTSVTTGNWKPIVCHWFKTQGPNGGSFNTKLTVKTKDGCEESFTFNASATNIVAKPIVVADYDSVCYSAPTIQFRLRDGPVPQATNPLYNFGDPNSGPQNILRQWGGPHTFTTVGPFKINFSYQHPIPGCGRTIYDTILIIGPQSAIEGPPPAGMEWLIDSLRYQCVIKDTVKFKNFSKFYHNDRDMTDDDSLTIVTQDSIMVIKATGARVTNPNIAFNPSIHDWVKPGFNAPLVHGFNNRPNGQTSLTHHNQRRGNSCTIRKWDFDDDYCEKCTTDTKNGVNAVTGINTIRNCKFSKDTLPQHWYSPWDSIYMSEFSTRPESILRYDRDSGLCYQRNLLASDSIAIIRDTFLYYGNNPLGKK
jgi:PKD repeat protein